MKEVGALWRKHKADSGGGMTSMRGGAMKGGSAKKAAKRPKSKDYAVLAGRGMGGYQPGVMTGGALKPVNEMVGSGFGDDALEVVGKVGKAVAPWAGAVGTVLPFFL